MKRLYVAIIVFYLFTFQTENEPRLVPTMAITSVRKARNFLILLTNESIFDEIEQEIDKWNLLEFIDDTNVAKNSINHLYRKLFEHEDEFAVLSLQWVVFDAIHDDLLLLLLYAKFQQEDRFFHDKFMALCRKNISADELGADKKYSIPLSAAIVELSLLDTYKSPIEKVNCICSTFDLIFAELKTALVAAISKYSDKDNDIPVINNDDIIPILQVVIIKSKLSHIYSNYFYIKHFHYNLNNDKEILYIYRIFEKAVRNLVEIDDNLLKPSCVKINPSMDLAQYMKLTSYAVKQEDMNDLVEEEMQRILSLISIATSDSQY